MARLRQARPVAPQVRVRELGRRGGGARENRVGARVERLRHALDVATLARGVPALVHHHKRDAGLVHVVLKSKQSLLQALELIFVLLGRERERVVDARKRRCVVDKVEAGSRGGGKARGLLRGAVRGSRGVCGGRGVCGIRRPRGACDLHRVRGLLARERGLERTHKRLRDDDVRAALVFPVHKRPRGEREVAALEHEVVDAIGVLVVPNALETPLVDAPRRGGVGSQALEALPLAFGGHVDEEFHDLVAIVDKAALELTYRREAHPGLLARRKLVTSDSALLAFLALRVKPAECAAHRALGCHGIPAAIVEGDRPARPERLPELLHERPVPGDIMPGVRERPRLVHVEIARHVNARRARIQVEHKVGDAASLARAVPSLEEHHKPYALKTCLLLQRHEPLDERVVGFLVRALIDIWLIQIDLVEHGKPLFT